MKFLVEDDVRQLFARLCTGLAAALLAAECASWALCPALCLPLLGLFVLLAAGVLGSAAAYFARRQKRLEEAAAQVRALLDGRDLFAMKERERTIFRRRNIGFVFQAFNLIPELTVEQNILFPVLLDYQKPDTAYLEELLDVLDLRKRRSHLPGQLSGGQQQRVAIGRALITRPALILADEPTGNLDTRNSGEVIALLKEASRKYAQTIVMITHSRSIAQTADRVLQVSDGVLTDFGRCAE